ncbi:MAG: hypothetical protein LUH04_19550 [Clostridium sp.]|nr:hypothetical protein [Clostridium sp.]
MSINRIQWIVAIVDRKKGGAAAEIFREMGAGALSVIRGHGTASSRIIDCLGLDEPEKEIVTGIAGPAAALGLFHALKSRLNFSRPGKGIVFAVPLDGVSASLSDQLEKNHSGPQWDAAAGHLKEESLMPTSVSYELIAAVIDDGLSNTVMDAARLAGCRGGTLVKARELGDSSSRTIFGLTMAEEREILFILVPAADKKAVMNAICQTILRETGQRGTVFSMPVGAVAGLAPEGEPQ